MMVPTATASLGHLQVPLVSNFLDEDVLDEDYGGDPEEPQRETERGDGCYAWHNDEARKRVCA